MFKHVNRIFPSLGSIPEIEQPSSKPAVSPVTLGLIVSEERAGEPSLMTGQTPVGAATAGLELITKATMKREDIKILTWEAFTCGERSRTIR